MGISITAQKGLEPMTDHDAHHDGSGNHVNKFGWFAYNTFPEIVPRKPDPQGLRYSEENILNSNI
jgi:hypothetical protein